MVEYVPVPQFVQSESLAFLADVEYVPCGQSLPVETREKREKNKGEKEKIRRKGEKDKGGKDKGGTT